MAKLISVSEKARYPFKSYPTQPCETLLFPGCSFPSQFPRTMDALSQLCRNAGMGVAYDCCGNPLEGFNEPQKAQRVIDSLNRRFANLGVKRAVFVCPNCLSYLDGKVNCEVVSIFDIFEELGTPCAGEFHQGSLFIPCPDKKKRVLEQKLRSLYDLSSVQTMEGVACSGLRPDLASRGPEYVAKLSNMIIDKADNQCLYTYCASCLGQFSRMGYQTCTHVVSVVLGVTETPDSAHALANRARRKFDRNTNPCQCGGSQA